MRNSARAYLLDVNVLVALFDSAHVHHGRATKWFLANHRSGWATCPITENGLIRVTSALSYPNLQITPGQAADSLHQLAKHYVLSHQFWEDNVSLTDKNLFDLGQLTSSKQTTDTYLAGLAFHKGAKLATLDAALAWKGVRGAGGDLIERI